MYSFSRRLFLLTLMQFSFEKNPGVYWGLMDFILLSVKWHCAFIYSAEIVHFTKTAANVFNSVLSLLIILQKAWKHRNSKKKFCTATINYWRHAGWQLCSKYLLSQHAIHWTWCFQSVPRKLDHFWGRAKCYKDSCRALQVSCYEKCREITQKAWKINRRRKYGNKRSKLWIGLSAATCFIVSWWKIHLGRWRSNRQSPASTLTRQGLQN